MSSQFLLCSAIISLIFYIVESKGTSLRASSVYGDPYTLTGGVDDRRTRQLSSLSSTHLQSAASGSEYSYADPSSEYGNYASAGHSHGYGHGGGGGGGGHGHGHGHGHKKDCNSALGLLGTLGLVSFLTAILRQMTTTAAAGGGRKKRDIGDDEEDSNNSETHRITRLMIPLLIRVGQARDGLISTECTTQEVCRANKVLIKELGPEGRNLGSMLTSAIGKMLKEVSPPNNDKISKMIESAARNGKSGLNCEILHKECPGMPPANVPQFISILNSPIAKAYSL